MLIYKKKKKELIKQKNVYWKETHLCNECMQAVARHRKKTQLVKITFKWKS